MHPLTPVLNEQLLDSFTSSSANISLSPSLSDLNKESIFSLHLE